MSQPPDGVPTCYRHPERETYIRCQRCSKSICPDCMHEAAVGFQCPECVVEGRRSTRQGLTAYGGKRSGNPAHTTIALIGLNAAVWLAIVLTGWTKSALVDRLALVPYGRCGLDGDPSRYFPDVGSAAVCGSDPRGAWVPGVADGAYWQLVTNMFTHVQIWHIGVNMLSLWILGPQFEALLGRTRFLVLYLLSGLTGSAVVYWLTGDSDATLGASGAIFGLLGALVVVVLKVGGDMTQILWLLAVNAAVTFLVPNISWQGHLGGLVGGAAITAILVFAPRDRRTTIQVAGVGLLAVLLLGAIVARTVLLV